MKLRTGSALCIALVVFASCSTGDRASDAVDSSKRSTDSTVAVGADPDSTDTSQAAGSDEAGGSSDGSSSGSSSGSSGSSTTNPPQASSAPGVTPTSVAISISAPFSGTYGAIISQTVDDAIQPWVEDVNARGGINGRKLVLKKIDNKSTSDGAVAACKEAQSNGTLMSVIVVTLNSGNIEPDCLDKASVPTVLTIAGLPLSPSWTQVKIINSLADAGAPMASLVKNVMKDGDKKLGTFYIENNKSLNAGYVAAAKEAGMTVGPIKRVEDNQSSFTSELLEMKNAGVQNIALNVGIEVFGILRDAKALNYAPHWVGAGWGIDEYAQAAGQLLQGVYTLSNNATSDSPGMRQFSEVAAKYGRPTASRSSMNVYGYALVVGEVLKRAGKNLTRASVMAAFASLDGFDTQMVGPVSWAKGERVGAPAMFPTVCCTSDNKWKGLGPARTRF
jgi:branched-chain amino acid transport system substrate-binding protein